MKEIEKGVERYSREEFEDIIRICQEYIIQELMDFGVSADEGSSFIPYSQELYRNQDDWDGLINSGLFHDAVGKVDEYTEDYVIVSTEY